MTDWFSDAQALWLTIKLAGLTVILLLFIGIPLAWWLTKYQGKLKPIFEALVALPLVSAVVAPSAVNAQSLNCNTAPFAPGCAFTVCITGAVPADPICNNSCNNVAGNCNSGGASAANCAPAPGNPANQQCDCICN